MLGCGVRCVCVHTWRLAGGAVNRLFVVITMSDGSKINMQSHESDAVRKAMAMLTEHFDNVALFINHVDTSGVTRSTEAVSGNFFAVKAQVAEWIDRDDIRLQEDVLNEMDGENWGDTES